METVTAKKTVPQEPPATGLSTVRLVVTVVIIIACFSALYPKFFHPIVLRMFGVSKPNQNSDSVPTHPPHRPLSSSVDPKKDDIKRHMHPGPHPGMRAAAEMNKQNKQGSSGRGGVMGMILPVYAFGIIGYLIYTLVKVFGRKEKAEESGSRRQPLKKPVEVETSKQEVDESNTLKGLEDLLDRASSVDPNISAEEMRELQKRLEETEKQMAQILSAMQHVSAKVMTVAAETVKSDGEANTNGNSSDSSPDISSYEVVDQKKDTNSSEVETVKASESVEDTQTENKVQTGILEDDNDVKDTEEILKEKQEEEDSGVRLRKGQRESSLI